jgi:WXG100 family type VII secretion target
MATPRVRADYDALARIAQGFERAAEANRRALDVIRRAKASLESGDWQGHGALAFYHEMDQEVLPSLDRLWQAFGSAQDVTLKISQIMKNAEDDAATIFKLFESNAGASSAASGGVLGAIGDFFGGAWDEGKDMVGGLWNMVADPVGTAKGLWYGVTHPSELWTAFKKPYVEAWESGHPWQAIGRGTLFAGSLLIGTKGLDKVGDAGKMGELGKTGEVAGAVRAAETAEAARLAEMARAGELSDVSRVGELARGTEAAASSADEAARIAASEVAAGGKAPYLMPEGFKLGAIEMPAGATPQVVGQAIEAPIREMVASHFGFELPVKAPSATGPDFVVPAAERARVGFDIADVKPLNEAGIRKFWDQLDSWRDNGWPGGPRGTGPGNPAMQGKAALFGYDSSGNVYLYGIYDM